VADAGKSAGQDVQEETPQELFMRQRHEAALAVVGIVFPAEGHLSVGHVYDAMVRDCDAMCVAGQIREHVFRTAEGFLGVNDPVVAE
jgi:hypothetical protein